MIDSVRGTQDWLPEQVARRDRLAALLAAPMAGAGYEPLDLPFLEHRELYLKKTGEELVGKLYDFTFYGRALALRPEWTASVLRAYIEHLRGAALPVRLRYAGPVFRYERPRRATYRQFSQVGLELLGASGPSADAEVVTLAVEGLRGAGIEQFQLTLGHIGLVRSALGSLGLEDRSQSILIWGMERLRNDPSPERGEQAQSLLDEIEGDEPVSLSALGHLASADIEALLLKVLPGLGVRLEGGGRAPEEIVARLVRKLRRRDSREDLERALGLLRQLAGLRGAPGSTLDAAAELLAGQDPATSAHLAELRTTIELLLAAGVPEQMLALDFGLGRGLHYYTGLIFEIDDVAGAQLCGGGRYDDLVAALGGPPTPAVGFAYGLERALAAAPAPPPEAAPCRVLVALDEGSDDQASAMRAAAQLRAAGAVALLDVRGRSLAANSRDAVRRGIRFVALVGPAGVRVRELPGGLERQLPGLEGLAPLIMGWDQ